MVWKVLSPSVSFRVIPAYKGSSPVMGLVVCKKSGGSVLGVARIIVKRKGSPLHLDFVDRSKLIIVKSNNYLSWEKVGDLQIEGIEEVVASIQQDREEFIGVEDPSIVIDDHGVIHLYFTIAFFRKEEGVFVCYLGHASGDSLRNLKASESVLNPVEGRGVKSTKSRIVIGYKELALSPAIVRGARCNLVEAEIPGKIVRGILCVEAKNFSSGWSVRSVGADPEIVGSEWCRAELSPCVLFPSKFVGHNDLLVGICNGRAPVKLSGGKEVFGKFCVGLFLFNPRTGKIPWVSPMPFLEDPDAQGITFASDFVQTTKTEGFLYAHVDDAFVRVYKLNREGLRRLLPEKV